MDADAMHQIGSGEIESVLSFTSLEVIFDNSLDPTDRYICFHNFEPRLQKYPYAVPIQGL